MRIWVITEKSSGAEMRPEGGGLDTSSFHAGFRLTGVEERSERRGQTGREEKGAQRESEM